ncbi:hypothetical protein BT96DRAFT_971059 [Gymnopus androsaceus JB14]|uniref:Uncharacterized protein n=1 Tax=Gymnopus androsaceus JB14 TaxID=1447944 RepID=A0A6A4IG20_9AGAR|nr:hypothetical protein BT96DRAFT_971059 [Gymnopus androsaceus JB14]
MLQAPQAMEPAVAYVRKIKQRCNPETYRQFLDILSRYHHSVFPTAWACLSRREQGDLMQHMINLLSKDYHIKQAEMRPNVIQTLTGLHTCLSPMVLPPHLIKYLAKAFGAWYISLEILGSSLDHLKDDEITLRENVLDSLADVYSELAEDDMFYGLWTCRPLQAKRIMLSHWNKSACGTDDLFSPVFYVKQARYVLLTLARLYPQKAYEKDFITAKLTHYEYIQCLQQWHDKYEVLLDSRPRVQPLDSLSHYLTEFQYSKVDEFDVPGQYTELQDKDNSQDFIKIQKLLPKFENTWSQGCCWKYICELHCESMGFQREDPILYSGEKVKKVTCEINQSGRQFGKADYLTLKKNVIDEVSRLGGQQQPIFSTSDVVSFRFTPAFQNFLDPIVTEGIFAPSLMAIGCSLTETEYALETPLHLFVRNEICSVLIQRKSLRKVDIIIIESGIIIITSKKTKTEITRSTATSASAVASSSRMHAPIPTTATLLHPAAQLMIDPSHFFYHGYIDTARLVKELSNFLVGEGEQMREWKEILGWDGRREEAEGLGQASPELLHKIEQELGASRAQVRMRDGWNRPVVVDGVVERPVSMMPGKVDLSARYRSYRKLPESLAPEERSSFRLIPNLGGNAKAIHQRVIRKIYGREVGAEVLEVLTGRWQAYIDSYVSVWVLSPHIIQQIDGRSSQGVVQQEVKKPFLTRLTMPPVLGLSLLVTPTSQISVHSAELEELI